MINVDNPNIFVLLIGIAVILGSLFNLFPFSYFFNIWWFSVGLIFLIYGFYMEKQDSEEDITYKFKEKIAYVWLFGVNIFQWSVVIYIYFFNQVFMSIEFYYMLIGSSLFTLGIIAQFYYIPYFSINNDKKVTESVRNKNRWSLKQIIAFLLGIIVSFAGLISFVQSESLLWLYFSLFGIMMIIYGYYLEINKVEMSFKYFILMASVIIIQYIVTLIIWRFDISITSDESSFLSILTLIIGANLLYQVRRSNMKYLGVYREKQKGDFDPVNRDIGSYNDFYGKLDVNLVQRTPEAFIGEKVQITGQITSKVEFIEESGTRTDIALNAQGLSNRVYLILSYPNVLPFKEKDVVTVYGEYYFPAENQRLKEAAGKKLPGIKVAYMKKA